MNDVQSRLAELLKAGVGDPPARVTVEAVRRQRARRRGVAAVGVIAAIAAVAAISTGLLGQVGNPSPAVSPAVSAAPVPCRPGWHVASGAVPAGDRWDRLVAVAGSASDDLWAVGDRLPDPRHVFPLLEHWDGRRWAYSAGASLGGRQAWLTSVAALSSDDVWAVGYFAPGRRLPEAPLIEHWNGRSWSLQQTEALTRLKGALPQTLASVAALAPHDVWVLGHGDRGPGPSDVFLHWNGASWKLFPGPGLISPRLGSAWMQALGTDHRGHVWAVGGWVRGHGEAGVPAGGIVERWNGRQWEVDRHAGWRKPLTMVAPVAPDDVWAITGGSFTIAGGGYGVSPVQVLHWNGSTWKVEPLGGTSSVDPTGLAAVSAGDAYVIAQNTMTQQNFIDHWDGTRWQSLPLGPAGHMQRLSSMGLTVTSDGSIAALATQGLADRANFLWLRCQH